MNKVVNTAVKNLNNNLRQKAKKEIKTNEKLKILIKDIKDHFKKKGAWSLSYEMYQSMSGVHSLVFIQVLLLNKMKIYFCNQRQSILFKKALK